MKRYIIMAIMALIAQTTWAAKAEGKCGIDTKWSFDGYTLTISNVSPKGYGVAIENYDLRKNQAPWIKKKLRIKRVIINNYITRIGSCAFANCQDLQEVVFQGADLSEIGWGAFLGCSHLRSISLPVKLAKIETVAFANCSALTNVKIPDHCRVEDQAYVNCSNLKVVEVAPTSLLGHYVFASEVKVDDQIRHSLYSGDVLRLPSYINKANCSEYGLAQSALDHFQTSANSNIDYDYVTSEVDSIIPEGYNVRNETYALIIGNQNYRFVSDVPYAIHDARVFAEYCKNTLGIPSSNIHVSEDATKQMILEEEIQDWVAKIPVPQEKSLIVYYAGHGVPDEKDQNKSYLLPTDVKGSAPQRGIALDEFYARLGSLAFAQTTVFLDACFSGINRQAEGVTGGLRGVEVAAQKTTVSRGNVVVFSAAQGNETAQGYDEEGHGLFTYYLLKEIQQSQGAINYGTLSNNLTRNVSTRAAELKLRKPQTPMVSVSKGMEKDWHTLKF